MGGGLWTSMAIPLVIFQGPMVVLGISMAAVVLWLLVWFFLFRKGIQEGL